MIKRSVGEIVFDIFNVLFMIVFMCVMVYPLLYVVLASISNASDLMAHRGLLLKPFGFHPESYVQVFKNPMIVKGYLNTIFIVVVGVTISIILTSLGAYFLSRKDVMWRNAVMFLILTTMFISGGLIPFYLIVKNVRLINTLWSLIIPQAINTFNLIIMRTSFASIPDSLEESAKIDGANDFTVLFRIVLPLSLPIIAVMILYYGVGKWNEWFYASVFLKNRELFPLQLILREILLQNSTSDMMTALAQGDKEQVAETIKYATIVVATLPVICVYPFLQKYFVKGVMIGAVKE